MKKHILVLILISLSFTAYSQDNSNRGKGNKIIRGPYETNRFFNNWFIGVGGGINIYNGNNDSHQKLKNRISTAIDFSIGKWITPAIGFRIQYSGLNAKGSSNFKSDYATNSLEDGYYNEEFNISNLHSDFLWNLSDAFSGYRKDRLWNIISYVGIGWVSTWNKTTNRNEYATSIGILNNVRLSNLLNLTIDGRYMLTSNRLDKVSCGSKYDGMASVTIGLSFKLGKRNFNRVIPPDYSSYNNHIAVLKNQNKQLKTEAIDLTNELNNLKNQEKEVIEIIKKDITINTTPVALFFKIGESTLTSTELLNLDFYVENAIDVDKNKVFTIIGTADSTTGNDIINQHLSVKRMWYVYNILVDKYDISPDRIIKKAEGDLNNRFNTPELNRTVIIQ